MDHKVNSFNGTHKCLETSTIHRWEVWQLETIEDRPPPRPYHLMGSRVHRFYRMDPIRFGSILQLPRIRGWRIEHHLHPPYPSHYKHSSKMPLLQTGHGHPQSISLSATPTSFLHNSKPPKRTLPCHPTFTLNNQIPDLSLPWILILQPCNPYLMLRLPNHPQIAIDAITAELKPLEVFR